MITIKDLSISYGQSIVLDSLNLQLGLGQIHGLVGLNGSGKTTLLHSMQGLITRRTGTITFNGLPLSKKEISYLPTENYFYPNITGREYLNLFQNKSFNSDDWNALFQLPLDQIIDGYSTGMKKKLALLGVLKQDKPILILDEPFNGLDIETARTLQTILTLLRGKGKTTLLTSHILESLTDLCDEIHYMEESKIQFSKVNSEFETFKKEMYEHLDTKNKDTIQRLI